MNKKPSLGQALVLICAIYSIGAAVYKYQEYLRSSNVDESIFIDDNDNKTYLWPDDKHCSRLSRGYSMGLKQVYLVSFPRSGNTWLRYLLEGATGVYSGSVYNDSRDIQLGFYGEAEPKDSGRVLVIKTHVQTIWADVDWSIEKRMKHIPKLSPVILLLRNPFKAIVSYWSLYMAVHSSLKEDKSSLLFSAEEHTYKSKTFRRFASKSIKAWTELAEDRLIWTRNLHVVFYEDILQEPIREIEKILQFLNFPVNKQRLQCLANHLQGPANKGPTKLKTDPFSLLEKTKVAYSLASVVSLAEHRDVLVPQVYHRIIESYMSASQ